MRTLTRKLLSLLLAFTMVCAMVPAAMAADTEESIDWGSSPTCTDGGTHTADSGTVEKEATCKEPGVMKYKCTVCSATGTATIPIDTEKGHDWGTDWKTDGTNHWHECTICQEKKEEAAHTYNSGKYDKDENQHTPLCDTCGYKGTSAEHNYDPITGECVCGAEKPVAPVEDLELTVTWNPNGNSQTVKLGSSMIFSAEKVVAKVGDKTVDVTPAYSWTGGTGAGTGSSYTLRADEVRTYTITGTVKAEYEGKTASTTKTWTVTVEQNVLTLSEDEILLNGRNDSEWLTATVNFPGYDTSDVTWKTSDYRIVDLSDNEGSSVRLYAMGNGNATVTATLKTTSGTVSATCRVYVKGVDAEISVGATVFNTNPGYALGDEDDDAKTSIVDQIRDEIDDITDGEEDLKYVKFYSPVDFKDEGELDVSTKKSYYLDPGKNDEDISDVVFIPDEEYKGKVTFTFLAVDTANDEYEGEIVFDVQEGTASAGDDFEDFWDDNSSKGSLDYVTFGSISSSRGTLVDADGDKVTSKKDYYVDPGKRELALDGVTFEPGRNTNSAVTIDFTAYGTNNKSINGTVVILYTENEPEAIVYSSTGKNITLDADDFLDNYKDTMGSSASNIQIQFLEVPSNGTLYYKYNERTEKGTELTSKNVANHTFSTSSRASKSIEDVTYVPDSRGRSDTVRFACYTSGGDLRYYGKVTFGQTVQNVTVNMTSTSSGVTFQASTFFNADDALLSANTISFGTPSSGTLYKNWNGTSGTRVTASDMFSYVASVTGNASISTVTYVPVAGYSGTVTIPFSAYGAAGGIVSGTVSIRVTATTPTTIFTDVPTTGSQAWAYPYINRLAAAGVVSGVTPTTYGPKQTVKWGEALKMVLLGAGHPAQVEGTGSNWASGYLTYAVNNGIVSNTNINLSSNITRLEMAELAAKALGMSPASRINTGIVGPTDTTNGYVYALYNAGIVGGDSSSGQNRYNGGSTLLRDEMAKIVCGVMDNA